MYNTIKRTDTKGQSQIKVVGFKMHCVWSHGFWGTLFSSLQGLTAISLQMQAQIFSTAADLLEVCRFDSQCQERKPQHANSTSMAGKFKLNCCAIRNVLHTSSTCVFSPLIKRLYCLMIIEYLGFSLIAFFTNLMKSFSQKTNEIKMKE